MNALSNRRWCPAWAAVWAVVGLLACVVSAGAAEVILNPVTDVWIREDGPDTTYEDDLLSVWAPGPENSRYGMLSFDLSGITGEITGATLELYSRDYWRNATATRQTASAVSPTDISAATWNGLASMTETPFETFGKYDIPADSPVDQFYASEAASAADLAVLNAAKTGGAVSMVLKGESWDEEVTRMCGTRDWADSGYFSDLPEIWPRLVLNGGSIEVVASVDTWIREDPSDAIYENDWISVWAGDTESGNRRHGMLEFDLSTVNVPITDAALRLYALSNNDSSHNWEAFEQITYSVDTAGTATGAVDWATYETLTKTQFEGLGHYEFAMNDVADDFCDSDAATAADLAVLDAIASADGALVMSLESIPVECVFSETLGGQRDWADTGYNAANPEIWPRLVLQIDGGAALEGDLNDDGLVGSGDLDIVRANWGQSVDPGCLLCGDPSGDGSVGSADLDIVRANWGSTSAAAVPEPSVVVLLLGFAAWIVRRRR